MCMSSTPRSRWVVISTLVVSHSLVDEGEDTLHTWQGDINIIIIIIIIIIIGKEPLVLTRIYMMAGIPMSCCPIQIKVGSCA